MSFLCQYIKKQRLDSYNIKRFFNSLNIFIIFNNYKIILFNK